MPAGLPVKQGLYDPQHEHDACGVGFLVHLKGQRSHRLIRDGITALNNLNHRGACGCEVNTGDGAGVLIQVPHAFFLEQVRPLGISLPGQREYGAGILFLPKEASSKAAGKRLFEKIVAEEGQRFLGWRSVPTDNSSLGNTARAVEPDMEQAFVGWGARIGDPDQFERKLYVIRRRFENAAADSNLAQKEYFYFPSLSGYTLVYKGMLTPCQLGEYFPDLSDPSMESALCMYHSRFSTNTFPSWELAHPYRMVAHNGEINTLRGNINWMRAREMVMESTLFEPGDVQKLLPIVREGLSDTATMDRVLELLIKGGRAPAHAMMMLIPEAWEHHETMSQEKKDFYAYHSCFMEPWDGPASVAFTDGKTIGATLDRNGLRPSRYWVTKDDLVIMASEAGVLDVPPDRVLMKGRLEPGRMFLVNMEEGRIVGDHEVKHTLARAHPYGEWLREHMVTLEDLPPAPHVPTPDHQTLLHRQQAFGYTVEDQKYILGPMAENGIWAIGSMGTDTPLAVLSDQPQILYNYFKQLFAQVTNPPLDCIREELVTSVLTNLGPEDNLLEPGPEAAHEIRMSSFVITNDELARLKQLDGWRGFKSIVLPAIFKAAEGARGMERALEGIFQLASRAIQDGATILILSDRGVDAGHAPIPSLLACAGLHHHLVREGTRTRVGLVVESGDAREVHHFCLLLGYGAAVINPYVAFESLDDMVRQGMVKPDIDYPKAEKNYIKAVYKGVVKVMAKMGISTVQSYRGAQIFEAIGLNEEFIEKYFTKTASRVGGIGIEEITREVLEHHQVAYPDRPAGPKHLLWGGQYQWRRDGEYHLFNPETVFRLQHATRSGRYEIFKSYTQRVDDQSRRLCTLRGLMDFKFDQRTPIPIEEVEPAASIVWRFCTGAMSYGSISAEAHETLAIAMNRLGGWSNTGEGGEDSERFMPLPNGDSRRSRIKQVASGRFGVTSQYMVSADELQIKMAQGAKPGEGGELPGHKVYPWIAKVRGTTPGVGLISPPPHHDIYSIEDLAQLIYDLKNSNPRARICVKLVAEVGVGTVAAGVAKAHSDVVLISGHDGGTGASPLTSIKYAGIPWELGLAETQQTLVMNKLRDRIIVQTDGQLKTGRDVAIAALLGAEEYGFATAPLVVMGCIMMRVCHLDTCPVGVATQNPALRERFSGQAEHVVNFFMFIAEELREIMARLGFRTIDEMIGRSDLLDMRKAIDHYKAKGLDFSKIFYRPEMGPEVAVRKVIEQDHGIQEALDQRLLRLPEIRAILDLPYQVTWCPAVQDRDGQQEIESASEIDLPKAEVEMPIRNVYRTVGAILGSEITRKFGAEGLPEDTIRIQFEGSAGQSFGAFVPRGMTLALEGDAQDYCGKGLSGGKVVVYPPRGATFVPEENIIIGNVALYGATGGRMFVRGKAGERFCVRNSGAHAVVEGTGDHCCEYMTGGIVVTIGKTGRNFGAGMSGGMAFALDLDGDFEIRLNREMVEVDPFTDPEDQALVRDLLQQHFHYTGSTVAAQILENWETTKEKFRKVMPVDYKRVLEEQKRQKLAEEGQGVPAGAE
jgi:glutamate synthase domain-containing protein 2/glutamate synthase domain-containing protein 1/glutamate synthase domain-containing protein 3